MRRQNILKKEKGITLVALVVTIVVLLILAGITISLVFSDNGVIAKANQAKELTKRSQTIEIAQLDILSAQLEGSITKSKLEEILGKYGTVKYVDDNSDNDISGLEVEGVSEIIPIEDIYSESVTDSVSDTETNITVTGPYTETDGTITGSNGKILHIGDYVEYDCTTSSASYTSTSAKNGYRDQVFEASKYTGKWRILGINDAGQIEIMAAENVPLTGGKDGKYYYLKGKNGYVNGISELNGISKIYANGTGAESGRSIDVDDINGITGYNPNNVGVSDKEQTGSGTKAFAGQVWEYGNTVTYKLTSSGVQYTSKGTTNTNSSYTSFTYYNGSGWSSLATNGSTNLTSSDYRYYPATLTETDGDSGAGISKTSEEYNLLFGNVSSEYYWLGSQIVYTYTGYACFGLRCLQASGLVMWYDIYSTDDYANAPSRGVRPVISLSTDAKLVEGTTDGDGYTTWTIQ